MRLTVAIAPHPLLDASLFVVELARPLAETLTPSAISSLVAPTATSRLQSSDAVRTAVRDLLRHGGFKPAGRSKPASEYLVGAIESGRFPQINALVDACNVVSLHAGLPISLVDVDRLDDRDQLAIQIAPPGTSYVFNPAGQVIDASGLVCLYDATGPTGTPVKDAQRTKTHDGTRRALAVVWGTTALPGRTAEATRWFRELCAEIADATTHDVVTLPSGASSP